MKHLTNGTELHIKRVQEILTDIEKDLYLRGLLHDLSKLESPEKEMFDKYSANLRTSTYGSPEYKKALVELGPALQHHYENNRHHPEHFENGIDDMNMIDLMELFADWKASSERHDNGDIYKSIDINKERFKMSDQLERIFINTAKFLGY